MVMLSYLDLIGMVLIAFAVGIIYEHHANKYDYKTGKYEGYVMTRKPDFNVNIPELEHIKVSYDYMDHIIYAAVLLLSLAVGSLYFF